MPAARSLIALGGFVVVALSLAACGGSSGRGSSGSAAPASGSASPSSSATSGGGTAGGAFANRGPAAAGLIAAITGTTMQVQSPQSGQVAVTWTTATTFTHQVAVALSTIKVGACVTAIAPDGTSATATSFAATSIVVTAATNGTCDRGAAAGTRTGSFPSGARPSGFPSGARPSGFPTGARASGRAGFGSIASGKVTAVSGSTITIAARQFGQTTTTTTAKTVTVGANATVTTQAATTSKSLAVGKCISAQGKADSSGTVTATRVQITNASGGQCTVGFGRVGNGG